MMGITTSFKQLKSYCEKEQFKGWDPYDGLNSKVFQALRIEINQEVESLKEMLQQCKELLKPGGRLVVITYHSIEDRLVKNFMKSGNMDGVVEKDFFGRSTSPFETQKMLTPTDEELERNPRSRSAKLRVAIKREEA